VSVVASFAAVLAVGHTVVGVDMPIGLSDRDPRRADIDARRTISPRGCTIFPTPVRACLDAVDYAGACARSLEITGKKISLQAWHILAKIREVDAAVTPSDEHRVIEVHPECSFALMNGGHPLASKHTRAGLEQRAACIDAAFRVPDLAWQRPPSGATRDDVLDAYAVLWSAERFTAGAHRELPGDAEQRDGRGLLMRIVT
jgi:predicted RNase H-like nuclease